MFALTVAILIAVGAPSDVRLECPDPVTFAMEAARYTGHDNLAGIYVYGEKRLILSPGVCGILTQIVSGVPPEPGRSGPGFSVFILAHELAHATGITDETQADCAAAAVFPRVAAALGLTRRVWKRLMIESAPVDGYDRAAIAGCWPSLMPNAV